jgi:hypothetical protein
MGRLILGLIKGGIVGAAVGFGVQKSGLGLPGWLVYGAIGFLVGLVVGRPIWSHLVDKKSTVWTGVMKALFGFGVGAGLWAIGAKALGDPTISVLGASSALTAWTPVFGAVVGVLYGVWVEIDDPPLTKADAPVTAKRG